MATLTIEAFDLDHASDADWRRLHACLAAVEHHEFPEDPPPPLEEIMVIRNQPSFVRQKAWVARRGDEIVGRGGVRVKDTGTNLHLGGCDVSVLPSERRRGIGSALLAPVVAWLESEGRSLVQIWTAEGSPGSSFVARLGGSIGIHHDFNRLRIADVDPRLLADWMAPRPDRNDVYELVGWDGPTPDEWLERMAAATNIMNTAPRDNLTMEDEVFTPERLRESEAATVAAGLSWSTLAAVERASGAVAGYTELSFPPWRDDIAWQGDTAVAIPHRGHGLGQWLKATMLSRVLERRPHLQKIDTGNAGSNGPMLAINHALGFRRFRRVEAWEVPVESIAKVLAAEGKTPT